MLERLIAVVREYVPVDRYEVDYNTSLRMDLGLNSLDLVNLAVSVENEFGIEISDRKLAMMKTVGDLIRHIETTQK